MVYSLVGAETASRVCMCLLFAFWILEFGCWFVVYSLVGAETASRVCMSVVRILEFGFWILVCGLFLGWC